MTGSIKIIKNGFIFTGDKQNRAGQIALLIQNGRITDLGKPSQVLKTMYPSAEIIDAAGKVLIPGFIDAHHTGESFILHYLTSGHQMSRWNKNQSIQRAFDYLQKDATYEEFLSLYRLSYYAALKSGVTTLAEYGMDNPEHSLKAAFESMQQVNVRGFIGLHNGDQMEAAQMMRDKSIRFALGIADEENLTTYNLQSSLRSARELQWPILLHLGQTRRAFDIVKKNFNKSIAKLYEEYRVFDSPVQLLHLSCFEEGDVEILGRTGVPIVISPSAMLQKGADVPPFDELFRNKILLALGSDWGVSQPLENIQTYASMLKTLNIPGEKTYELLALHTKNGAKALGLDDEIGTIEFGKKADITFLDLSDFRIHAILADESAEKVLSVVLQEATSQHVSDVMINGEFYVREKHLLTYSEEDLAQEAQVLMKKFTSFGSQKPLAAHPSAAIFQLSGQHNADTELLENDLPFEEGFKVVQKGEAPSMPPEKRTETKKGKDLELPNSVRKVFGADDL